MRLRADIWVKAYIRACAVANCSSFVVRHGDDAAGAIYIKINHLDGTANLFGPAPMSMEETTPERRFNALFDGEDTPEPKVDDLVRRLTDGDPDVWLIEVEDAKKRHFLDGWLRA